jgi:predicted phage baseplate assembly protein
MTVRRGTQASTVRTESADALVFTTTADLTALPCACVAVRTRSAGEADSVERDTAAATDPFPAFGEVPAVGDELLIGLDDTVGGCAVRLDLVCRIEGLGVDPRRPPLVWEAWTGSGWTACEVDEDQTGGLNRSGAVVLHVPTEHRRSLEGGVSGGGLRARATEPDAGCPAYTTAPTISEVSACTVGVTGPARHAELIEHEPLGRAEGVAGQVFQLTGAPVLAGTDGTVLEVSTPDGWQDWHEVPDFTGSGPGDRHFLLDAVAGEVRLGPVVRLADGTLRRYGSVPPRGAEVRVRDYGVGGGAAGNVGAGTITLLRSSVPFVGGVVNRRSAHGGTEAETLDEARDRAPMLLRTRGRAVTAEDYEALAAEAAPETARLRCITAGNPGVPAGTVKLLVVPAVSAENGRISFADLRPSPELLSRLADRLDDVRLIGTKVLVEPPRYRGVTVVARLVARPRADLDEVRERAEAALFQLLNPLPGGGPDGAGWPFGQPVRVGDLHALLQRVRGVDAVEDVRLFTANPVTGERGDETNRIDLAANSLVFSYEHQVRVDTN